MSEHGTDLALRGNGTMAPQPVAGAIAKSGMDGDSIEVRGETTSAALAAQAQASVQARYLMAWKRPRNMDDVRTALLRECRRPGFAESARYRKPIGKGVEGFSIRFVETALRCMTNALPEATAIYEDPEKRILRCGVTDLEANVSWTKDITISKTVERSRIDEGVVPISKRKNSRGQWTYLVPATDDDLLNKENALVSKALRTCGLRLIPGDLQDEAEAMILETLRNQDAADPDAARKKIVDAFSSIGVKASELTTYAGKDLAGLLPVDLAELRAVFQTVKDGEATWVDVLAAKTGTAGKDPKAAELTAKIREKAAPKGKGAPPAAQPGASPSNPGREPGDDQ